VIKYVRQAWLVLVLTAFFGGALAGVHVGLSPIIEANKKREILGNVPRFITGYREASAAIKKGNVKVSPGRGLVEVLLGEGEQRAFAVSEAKALDLSGGAGKYTVYQVKDAGKNTVEGYVIRTKGQGFADVIEILVGYGPGGMKLTGIYVLSQKETPGVGNKIEKPKFTGQFDGIPVGKLIRDAKTGATAGGKQVLKIVKQGKGSRMEGKIDAISGATVSSRAVVKIVNEAVEAIIEDWNAGKLMEFEYPEKKQ